MSFLQLDRLTKRFGDFVAVETLDLGIERGEFVSLLGPSGCGKTTTLQMIAGLQRPTEGRIRLDGEDITDVPPNRRGLGIVFQSYALFPHMTAAENIAFGLEMRGVARADRAERVDRALDQVQLGRFAHRYPKELSGGQRQRVALARALVIEPPLLLLDEPLSNLDAKLREEMQLELRLLQQRLGVTTVLVTHDQSEALSMSDRVVVMERGRAVQIDTPLAMYEAPSNAFVSGFVGKTNLFEGTVESADAVRIGERVIAAPVNGLPAGTPVQVSLRPEKIALAPQGTGLEATVDAVAFHGSHWLYSLSTPLGEIIAVAPNTGSPAAGARDRVGLAWAPDALRVLAAEPADG